MSHTSGSSSSTVKGQLYSSSLDLARRRSLWSHPQPADSHGLVKVSDSGGVEESGDGRMSWKELIRKFTKHTHREVTAHAAATDQTLHSLLLERKSRSSTALPAPLASSSTQPLLDSLSSLTPLLTSSVPSPSASSEIDQVSAKIVAAHATFYLGDSKMALERLEALNLELPPGGEGEPYDLVLRVVGCLVQAYATEQLGRAPDLIKAAYSSAATRYDETCDLLSRGGNSASHVELHRVGSEALFRNCVHNPTLSSHALYYARSVSLPPSVTFPLSQLLPTYRAYRQLVPSPSPALSSLNRAEEALLRRSTKLPPAGEVNKVYTEFLDEVADAWKRGGASRDGAQDVVDIMYNALTHTFQSHRLLRYLILALSAKGSYSEALKALNLYTELGEKSRLTDAKKVARDVRRFREKARRSASGEKVDEKSGQSGAEEEEDDLDIDTDHEFVKTVVLGGKMCVKRLDDPEQGLRLLKVAKEVFEKSKEKTVVGDEELEGALEEALGVCENAQALRQPDRTTRQHHFSLAYNHLSHAATLLPQSFTAHYHLSYHLAQTRQISLSLSSAKTAATLSPSSLEVWHLLALLVSATKDLGEALQVLETGLDEGLVEGENAGGEEELVKEVEMRMTRNLVIEALEGADAAIGDQQAIFGVFRTGFDKIGLTDGLGQIQTAQSNPEVKLDVDSSTPKRAPSLLSRKNRNSLAIPITVTNTMTTNQDTFGSNPIPALRVSPPGSIRPGSSLSLNVVGPTTSAIFPSSSPSLDRNPRATKLLVDLWLMAASSYRRAGKTEDALGAIQQAEELDAEDPDVWSQFALYNLSLSLPSIARTSLIKALSFNPIHVPSLVILARLYLSTNEISDVPFAQGLMKVTQKEGWDVPEAWFELSRCFKAQLRIEKERECLKEALRLEETRSIRSWKVVPSVL